MQEGRIVTQAELREKILPVVLLEGKKYRKFKEVMARPARAGEYITTRTSRGIETENVAEEGDQLVENQTTSRERYLVSAGTFKEIYEKLRDLDGDWSLYRPKGEVTALKLTSARLAAMGMPKTVLIEAPWGETETINEGDYLVCPKGKSEIYGIASDEFRQTYAPSE